MLAAGSKVKPADAPLAKMTSDARPNFSGAQPVQLPIAQVKAVEGAIHLAVKFTLPSSFKMNALAPMRYYIEAAGPAGPIDPAALARAWLKTLDQPAAEFDVRLPVKQPTGRQTLKLSMNYFYCQEGESGICKMGTVSWTIPVELTSDAAAPESVPVPLAVR